jgi:hypothetical protein
MSYSRSKMWSRGLSDDGDDSTNVASSWSSSTICSIIPSGDPYRTPGNMCSSNGVAYTFDSNGNVVTTGGGATTTDSSGNIVPKTGAAASSSSGGFWGAITSIGSSIMGGANAAGQAAAYNAALANQTPSWLPLVAIGGIGLIAVVMLTGPKSNPARRRRRHRRSRR